MDILDMFLTFSFDISAFTDLNYQRCLAITGLMAFHVWEILESFHSSNVRSFKDVNFFFSFLLFRPSWYVPIRKVDGLRKEGS
jgi:hypothetical protein